MMPWCRRQARARRVSDGVVGGCIDGGSVRAPPDYARWRSCVLRASSSARFPPALKSIRPCTQSDQARGAPPLSIYHGT